MLLANGCWATFKDVSSPILRGCIMLDRDGVLIPDVGYPHRLEHMQVHSELAEILAELQSEGWIFGFITNQGGIGLGKYSWLEYQQAEEALTSALNAYGAQPSFWIACPYHPEAKIAHLHHPSHPWRKPNPGMLHAVLSNFGLASEACVFVGDRLTDMQAAQEAGIQKRILFSCDPSREGRSISQACRNETFVFASSAKEIRDLLNSPYALE
jgi:D-glycero-D-manno-heptose 1,7-bisphosphate phosphatase